MSSPGLFLKGLKVLRLIKLVFFRFTHLQHVPYTISIQVNNDSGAQRLGMVRIFMAPKFDDRGSAYLFKDQRLMMIELDKFVAARKIYTWR